MSREEAIMSGLTGAPPHLPREIAGWECHWQMRSAELEITGRRLDRRTASIGQALAGRILIRRTASGSDVETRLWILEDLAEHQRLRTRRGTAATLSELHDLLVDAGLPSELALSISEAASSL
jgi:hypothetical protein